MVLLTSPQVPLDLQASFVDDNQSVTIKSKISTLMGEIHPPGRINMFERFNILKASFECRLCEYRKKEIVQRLPWAAVSLGKCGGGVILAFGRSLPELYDPTQRFF